MLPGLMMAALPEADPVKSPLNVGSRPLTTPDSAVIRPSSRLLLSELDEKFSDPANALALDVPAFSISLTSEEQLDGDSRTTRTVTPRFRAETRALIRAVSLNSSCSTWGSWSPR